MEGWIKLHRQIKEHWIWNNPEYLKAWLTILLTVNHDDKKVLISGELIECNRGQSILSLQSWAKLLGNKWTIQRVRTFFELLKKDSMIITEGLNKSTRLTVCNYDTYQDQQQTDNKQKTFEQQTDNKQVTTNKNDKNEKEENNTSSPVPGEVNIDEFYLTKKKRKLSGKKLEAFKIFWQKFNYQKGKSEAADSWLDIEGLSPKMCEFINKAAEIEASKRPDLIQYGKTPKMAQGWLTARRWEDEIYTAKETIKKTEKPKTW